MTTHADLRPGTAVHACAQCKASKKKCDKTLPSCDRCSRLVLQCNYDEGAGITPAEIISRFEAVFDRLGRLEENVFPPTAVTNASPASPASPAARSSTARPTDLEAEKLQISPRLLQPSYLDIIAGANVHKILEEKSMTMRGVVHRYCDIHNYMPIISKAKINKQIQEAEALNTNSAFMVLIIAILLLTEHPTTHDGAPGLSELYRVCKYHFSLFSSLKDPSVELLQVGLCIALYEYAHCITERAYITIGICARMASLLGLRYDNDSSPQYALTEDYFDESAHIITAMRLLNRHIYLSLTMLGKHLSVEYSTIIDAPDPPETPVSGWVADSFRYETEGCRILCRLQQTFHEESAVRGPGISGSTQLDRVLALDNELQSMKLNLQDYNDPPTWRGEFAAYTVASVLVFNFLSQQEGVAATECFDQRHIEILTSIELLVKMVNSQLSEAAASGYNADLLTPFSMTILALGAESLKSLSSVEIGDEYISSQRRGFIDMLRCLGARWRLGEEYLKIIGPI